MTRLNDEKVFKDPIHGFVRVTDPLIWNLIQTPEFQRLRRIKQLGGTHIVFPTAEHSRFSHSLGVYYIADRIIKVLKDQNTNFTEHERLLILCAALLHDLGHGPFSHSFEAVLGEDHEEFTKLIICGHTAINQHLEAYQENFSKEVSQVIDKSYHNKLIVSIISSQVDADRLDYLLRDSYFSGTTYGEIDLERILRTIRVHDDKLVFKYSGMHAIEDYLFSRYQMFWQVYLHDCSLSFNLLIKSFLLRVRDLIEEGFNFKQDVSLFRQLFFVATVDVGTYLKFDDGVITTFAMLLMEEDDEILRDLCNRFLNRGLFNEFEYVWNSSSCELMKRVTEMFAQMGISDRYYLFDDRHQQSTYTHYGMGGEEAVELLMPSGEIVEISRASNIISGIVNAPKLKHTLFLPLDMIKKLPAKDEIFAIIEQLIGREIDV